MATVPAPEPIDNVAELLDRLGNIPADRIRMQPPPGSATEADVLAALEAPRKRICELIEGVLVEKAIGFRESCLGVALLQFLKAFVARLNLGLVAGADGMVRLWVGRTRAPDVGFFSWARIPGREMPQEPLPTLAPDLAVEVLSRSNTPAEMRLKRNDYFRVGVRLVWEIDPEERTVAIYESADNPVVVLTAADTLDGGEVLPGFRLPLAELFAELDSRG
jgi:Uma2 family endonuclease